MTHTKSKVIKGAYMQWKYAYAASLGEVYSSYSQAKQNAMDYCRNLMYKHNGCALRIIGHNCMTFSVGFLGDVDGRDAFFYITRDYDRYIFLDELLEG